MYAFILNEEKNLAVNLDRVGSIMLNNSKNGSGEVIFYLDGENKIKFTFENIEHATKYFEALMKSMEE